MAFVPEDSPKPDGSAPPPRTPLQSKRLVAAKMRIHWFLCVLLVQDNADPVLLGDHDVALASIEKVVVGKKILQSDG